MNEDRISGATVSVFDHEGTAVAAFGAQELQENVPATPNTLLGIDSCTKSSTRVAILQLVAADKLAVDDPVSARPDAYDDASSESITIRFLLTHSSGLHNNEMGGVDLYRQSRPSASGRESEAVHYQRWRLHKAN